MVLERYQIASIIFNTVLFLINTGLTGILVWRLKFHDKNSRLLFILYILYWMSPLLCREYTGQMHLHMQYINDYGMLLWVPLIVYGLIGMFWRPLSDIFSYKFRSRKKVIYLSLVLQVATIIPFLMYPCFTTNIIQSIGAGIGASCIGLFNLMFDDRYHHRKVFATVTIVALPPLIAELLSSNIEAICCTFLIEGTEGRYEAYTNVMKYLWAVAIVFILASIMVAVFVKEQKAATIYRVEKVKEPVKHVSDWWVVILVCLAGACVMFVRWATAGPTATSQFIFMGYWTGIDTRFSEAYLSCMFAVGSIIGTILAGAWLTKSKLKNHSEKLWLVVIAAAIWCVYLVTTSALPNIPTFFFMNIVNGLAFGLVWPGMTAMMVNKSFTRTRFLSPMGLFNMFLSLGISVGTFCNNWIKGDVFDFQSLESKRLTYDHFIQDNTLVNGICISLIGAVLICMVIAFIVHVKFPPKPVKMRKLNVTGESEI